MILGLFHFVIELGVTEVVFRFVSKPKLIVVKLWDQDTTKRLVRGDISMVSFKVLVLC